MRLVLEIDDDLLNVEKRMDSEVYLAPERVAALRLVAEAADRVIVSTAALGRTLREVNPAVECVPNALDERLWLARAMGEFVMPRRTRDDGVVRILFMGT